MPALPSRATLAAAASRCLLALAWLPACAASPPAQRATAAPARHVARATTNAARPSALDDPAIRAVVPSCPAPRPDGQCVDGCQWIAGRCRRIQGGISQPEVVGGAGVTPASPGQGPAPSPAASP